MKYFLTFTLFSCLFHFHNELKAQDVYSPAVWITQEGDSISGLVQDHIIKGKYIHVKMAEDEKPIKKSADDISRIYQNNILTISAYTLLKKGDKENIFFELMASGGDIGLFKGEDKDMGKLFAVWKNQQFTVLRKSDLTSSYNFLYGDCNTIDLTDDFKYTEKGVVEVFENYIACQNISIESTLNPRKRQKVQILIGPKLGYTFGKFSFPDQAYFTHGEYSTITSPKIGMAVQIGISRKFYFQTEISYLNKTSSSDSVNTPPTYDPSVFSNLVEYDFDLIDWQFHLNYLILKKSNFNLNVGFGLNMGFLVNSQFSQEANGYWIQDYGPPSLDFSRSQEIGVVISLGGTYYTKSENQLQLNLKLNLTDMDYYLYRDSDVKGGIGAGSTTIFSNMIEIGANYFFRLR